MTSISTTMWKEINGVKPAKISSGEHIEILLVVACASVQKINVRVFVALAHDTFTLKIISSSYAGFSTPFSFVRHRSVAHPVGTRYFKDG